MTLKFQSLFLLFGLFLWVLLSPSCKQDDYEQLKAPPVSPEDTSTIVQPETDTLTPTVDTTAVVPPEENTDSIQYGVADHLLYLYSNWPLSITWPLLIDSASSTTLKFSISSSNSGSISITISSDNCQMLDNSHYGYPDALAKCAEINASSNWRKDHSQISSTIGAGAFRGKNDRYLGIRFPSAQGGYHYGWVRLSVNNAGDQLTISDFAFRTLPDQTILAGQTNLNVPCVPIVPPDFGQLTLITDKSEILGNYKSGQSTSCGIQIHESDDPAFDFTVQYFPFMWPYPKIPGRIVNGKLSIPEYSYSGNFPSPGGTDRPYAGKISGSGEMFVKNQTITIVWQINYNSTGFMSGSYQGEFVTELCQ